MINAAGVLWFNNDVSLEKISLKIWDKVMDINLRSIVIISQTILPLMKKNKFGSIVNISSIDALSGDDKPQDAYGTSKAALLNFQNQFLFSMQNTKLDQTLYCQDQLYSYAKKMENKSSCEENLSKNIPLQRIGLPKDIANASIFLLSDQSEFITGIELIVDGGLTARP